MIHIEETRHGYSVQIGFNEISDIMMELSYIISAVRDKLRDGMPDEAADRVITTSAKIAYAESNEEETETLKELALWLEGNVEELKTKEGQ